MANEAANKSDTDDSNFRNLLKTTAKLKAA